MSNVSLLVESNAKVALTVAWKAFEQELIVNSIKADLVQLNGYYQYVPKFVSECEISDSVTYANVLRVITCKTSIPEIKHTEELATEWKIGNTEVRQAATYLRELGFEIRNHSTNPQIEKDCWLVPYAFPTLTPLSVQLWKKI